MTVNALISNTLSPSRTRVRQVSGVSAGRGMACRLAILAALGLVHAAFLTSVVPTAAGAATPASRAGAPVTDGLPPAVAGMRDVLLDAVQSGRLEDLKYAADLNELMPELAAGPVPDPVAYWRSLSVDGKGQGVLTALGTLLDLPYAVTPLGRDPENSRVFVWPAFADRPLASLTPAEDAGLLRLEGADGAQRMKAIGRYTGWRLMIGADGVWHAFRRDD